MVTVYFSDAEGSSRGRDFRTLDKALTFAEDVRGGMTSAGRATLVDSDGVHMRRRIKFVDGDVISYEVQRNGRMVHILNERTEA